MKQKTIDVVNKIKDFLYVKLDALSNSNPQIAFLKPFAIRYIDNKMNFFDKLLLNFADENGMIDFKEILNEMLENIINSEKLQWDLGIAEKLEIEHRKLKVDIPFLNKQLIFTEEDIKELTSIM